MSAAKRQRAPSSSASSSCISIVDVTSILECTICNNPFDETARLPRLLPCGHQLCTACLAGLVKQKTARSKHTIACPSDGQECIVKDGDVTTLATNFGLLPLIAAARRPPPPPASESGGVPCELCEEQHDATHRCLECQQSICEAASKMHRRQGGRGV